jgi:hypothetical protein
MGSTMIYIRIKLLKKKNKVVTMNLILKVMISLFGKFVSFSLTLKEFKVKIAGKKNKFGNF